MRFQGAGWHGAVARHCKVAAAAPLVRVGDNGRAQGATPGGGAGDLSASSAGCAASGQAPAWSSHWPAPRPPLPLPRPLIFGRPCSSTFSRHPGVLDAMCRAPHTTQRCRKPDGQASSKPVQRPALKSKQAPALALGWVGGAAGWAGCAAAAAAAAAAASFLRPLRDFFHGGSMGACAGGRCGWIVPGPALGVKPSSASTTAKAAAGLSSNAGLHTCLSHHHCRAPSSK